MRDADPRIIRLEDPELLERLAAVEHERWAHWQEYLHSQCEQMADGSLAIPSNLVAKWERQIATPYSELSEKEKQSDRDQVALYLTELRNLNQE